MSEFDMDPVSRPVLTTEAQIALLSRLYLCPRILTQRTLPDYTGLGRSTIWEHIAKGTFPPPIRLSANRVGWERAEVDKWLDARAAERPVRGWLVEQK
jgi:prophage regulatory protein